MLRKCEHATTLATETQRKNNKRVQITIEFSCEKSKEEIMKFSLNSEWKIIKNAPRIDEKCRPKVEPRKKKVESVILGGFLIILGVRRGSGGL